MERCAERVFPTHVGMFRSRSSITTPWPSFPHSRGDVPTVLFADVIRRMFSPLTWGCSDYCAQSVAQYRVFPTHVGMFLLGGLIPLICACFPHSRGDVPASADVRNPWAKFSPLTWGCSEISDLVEEMIVVFPTHVGMFRIHGGTRRRRGCFPHSRGDVPSKC